MRSIAAKAWRWSAAEPADGTPPGTPSWFLEDVKRAAELYALELRASIKDHELSKVRVNVRDTEGRLHTFDVEMRPTIHTVTRRVEGPGSS